jgi:predicted transposase YbfD/YdcC
MENREISFIDFFKEVPDHRIERCKLYKVEEILLIVFSGLIAGCDSWDDLEMFGKIKQDCLRKYMRYKNGVPSDDTMRRFFRALNPKIFEDCFTKWVKSFQMDLEGKVVAIDGKTSRRSFDGENRPMHLISALASEVGIILGQLKTDDKSNEITAIPELLEILDIAGTIVTIDAIGCQTKIVEKLVDKKADYLIALKSNQFRLNNDVRSFFKNKNEETLVQGVTDYDKGHGRIESRTCKMSEDIAWLKELYPKWKGLNSIIEIESKREIKGEISTEKRYYISSLKSDPTKALRAIRDHWGVENKLHWVLDVVFNDDLSRIRKGNAPRNIAIVKKTALNLLRIIKKDKPRASLKALRKCAGWDNDFLNTVLMVKF